MTSVPPVAHPADAHPTDAHPTDPRLGNPWPHLDDLAITAVRTVATAPEGIPLLVVVVETSEPGLIGLGCATFTQRWTAVRSVIEDALAPLVVGRHPGDITDLGRLAAFSGYWRQGPVINNAISGLDMALWDIAGKRAGMPVHDLLGGRVRAAADTYAHADGADIPAVIEHAQHLREQGYRTIRIQVGQQGRGSYGASPLAVDARRSPYPDGWSVAEYLTRVEALFATARAELGEDVELAHDVHSRLDPRTAVTLARRLERYRPYFLEDVVAPEHWDRLPEVRAASPVPIAVGELATSFRDAARLVTSLGVDFIRCHLSAIGGLSAGLKVSTLAEVYGVRTAWHSPADTSPIGAAANLALDVSSVAFGIQESHRWSSAAQDVFPGAIDVVDGWLTPNEAPGWGITLEESVARRFPASTHSAHDVWAAGVRDPDGALRAP